MTTRTVTGSVLNQDGDPWVGSVLFELLQPIISNGDVFPAGVLSVALDANGDFETELGVPSSGTALYKLTLPDDYKQIFYLGAGSSIDLSEILSIPTVSVDPNYITELTSLKITYTDADLELTAAHEYVWSDGTVTITLPASTGSGDVYFISNQGTGTITVAVTGSDTINGLPPVPIYPTDCHSFVDAVAGNWHSL